uniref:Nuclear receptor domain-containing protein n=1 Tax=Heterorhabditis bacteriophora TaxID=37862 RepID=A0A1I7X5C6_HETBA
MVEQHIEILMATGYGYLNDSISLAQEFPLEQLEMNIGNQNFHDICCQFLDTQSTSEFFCFNSSSLLNTFSPEVFSQYLETNKLEMGSSMQVEPPINYQNKQENNKRLALYQSLPKNICPTSCAVCGDSAFGYHYELFKSLSTVQVPSCNGCKTFFRRTVLAQRKYECEKGDNCFRILPKEYSSEKRCGCRACRFKQCIDVGMNPLAIQMPYEPEKNGMVREILLKRKAHDISQLSTLRDAKVGIVSLSTNYIYNQSLRI